MSSALNQSADAVEVSPGTAHEQLQGWIPTVATEAELSAALEKAFDYRGDVTITRKSGEVVEGYLFDRRKGSSLDDSLVRILSRDSDARITIPYSEIAALAFTGRDTAAGKSWEAWVSKYKEKRAAGETNIGIAPEALD